MKKLLYQQFGHPTGLLGQFVGWAMAIKNRPRQQYAVEQIDARPGERILEIGYGPGIAIHAMTKTIGQGEVVGVDHSAVMHQQACRRNAREILQGKARLFCGTLQSLPYGDSYFDKIFASNVHFFWKGPIFEFQKCHQLLAPAGQIILAFQPRWARSEEEVIIAAKRTQQQLKKAGFENFQLEYRPMKPVTCIALKGYKH